MENGRPTDFFVAALCEIFGGNILPSPPEIDRAHRTLAPKLKPGNRPRPVILRFHRFQTKELILRETRRRGVLNYVTLKRPGDTSTTTLLCRPVTETDCLYDQHSTLTWTITPFFSSSFFKHLFKGPGLTAGT